MCTENFIRIDSQIRKWLPDVGLASVRLHAGSNCSLEVEQPGGRTDQNGQFVLAVDRSQSNPNDLFEQAQSAEEVGDIAEAERLYRILMRSDPTASALRLSSALCRWLKCAHFVSHRALLPGASLAHG